jgi:carbon storage regulator
MLVLSRKVGQSILIDGVKVTITASDRGKVRLGIDAPPQVRVDREEVRRRVAEFAEPCASKGYTPTY